MTSAKVLSVTIQERDSYEPKPDRPFRAKRVNGTRKNQDCASSTFTSRIRSPVPGSMVFRVHSANQALYSSTLFRSRSSRSLVVGMERRTDSTSILPPRAKIKWHREQASEAKIA